VTRLAHRFVVYMAAVTRFAFTKGGSRALPSYAPSLNQAPDQAGGEATTLHRTSRGGIPRPLRETSGTRESALRVCGLQPQLPPVQSRQLCHQIRTAVQF
jgi:hypothetical protein